MIQIVDYNLNWPKEFEQLKSIYLNNLSVDVLSIEHVGSTSIKGLKSKPKIDMDIIIPEDTSILHTVIRDLDKLGYNSIGDLGITGREAFRRRSAFVPEDGSGRIWTKHNLYICFENSVSLQNHLTFRDYLRNHKDKMIEYGQLKEKLALKYPNDIDAYTEGKTRFITEILTITGFSKEQTELITDQNRC